MPAPLLDQNRGISQLVEDLHFQQLVSGLAVEGLALAFLPWAAGLDERRADTQPVQPISNCMGAERRPLAPLLPCSLARQSIA